MLKGELIKRTAHASGQPQAAVRMVFDAMVSVVKQAIAKGDYVMLAGVGKLYSVQRGEKRARNLRTGETVIVPPRKAVLLQASDSLVESANAKS